METLKCMQGPKDQNHIVAKKRFQKYAELYQKFNSLTAIIGIDGELSKVEYEKRYQEKLANTTDLREKEKLEKAYHELMQDIYPSCLELSCFWDEIEKIKTEWRNIIYGDSMEDQTKYVELSKNMFEFIDLQSEDKIGQLSREIMQIHDDLLRQNVLDGASDLTELNQINDEVKSYIRNKWQIFLKEELGDKPLPENITTSLHVYNYFIIRNRKKCFLEEKVPYKLNEIREKHKISHFQVDDFIDEYIRLLGLKINEAKDFDDSIAEGYLNQLSDEIVDFNNSFCSLSNKIDRIEGQLKAFWEESGYSYSKGALDIVNETNSGLSKIKKMSRKLENKEQLVTLLAKAEVIMNNMDKLLTDLTVAELIEKCTCGIANKSPNDDVNYVYFMNLIAQGLREGNPQQYYKEISNDLSNEIIRSILQESPRVVVPDGLGKGANGRK